MPTDVIVWKSLGQEVFLGTDTESVSFVNTFSKLCQVLYCCVVTLRWLTDEYHYSWLVICVLVEWYMWNEFRFEEWWVKCKGWNNIRTLNQIHMLCTLISNTLQNILQNKVIHKHDCDCDIRGWDVSYTQCKVPVMWNMCEK